MRAQFEPYLRFVRSLPCCVCGSAAPSEASHVPTAAGQTAMGMKVPDLQTVPKCHIHHMEWEERRGWCEGWTREGRYDWAREMVKTVQAQTVPDTYEQALDLAALGLGRIEADYDGSWKWCPNWMEVSDG